MASKDSNTAVRRGYLTLHRNPGGRFALSTLSSKRMWMVLCRKGPSGKPRIEMYRSEDSVAGQQPTRMIDLETVRSVQPVERKKGFLLELPDETMLLQCTSKADMEDWVRDTNRLRGGRVDLASGQDIGGYPPGHDIYEVVPDDETFRARLRKSSTVNFSGACLLEIQRDFDRNLFHIALFTESEPPRLIVRWQIDHIRQYGSNNMAFKFQSGSKSSTGVDWFIVDTGVGAAVRIHKAVDYWAKHIVDQIKNTRPRVGRAPSIPCPAIPDRPLRSHTNPPPIEFGSCPPNSAYAPLDIHTREQAGVYQTVSPSSGKKRSVEKKGSGVIRADSGNSTGVYQALVEPNRDSPSTYAMVNVQEGRGGARGGPTSPTGGDSVYMGLRQDTRQPDNGGNYACPDRQ